MSFLHQVSRYCLQYCTVSTPKLFLAQRELYDRRAYRPHEIILRVGEVQERSVLRRCLRERFPFHIRPGIHPHAVRTNHQRKTVHPTLRKPLHRFGSEGRFAINDPASLDKFGIQLDELAND